MCKSYMTRRSLSRLCAPRAFGASENRSIFDSCATTIVACASFDEERTAIEIFFSANADTVDRFVSQRVSIAGSRCLSIERHAPKRQKFASLALRVAAFFVSLIVELPCTCARARDFLSRNSPPKRKSCRPGAAFA